MSRQQRKATAKQQAKKTTPAHTKKASPASTQNLWFHIDKVNFNGDKDLKLTYDNEEFDLNIKTMNPIGMINSQSGHMRWLFFDNGMVCIQFGSLHGSPAIELSRGGFIYPVRTVTPYVDGNAKMALAVSGPKLEGAVKEAVEASIIKFFEPSYKEIESIVRKMDLINYYPRARTEMDALIRTAMDGYERFYVTPSTGGQGEDLVARVLTPINTILTTYVNEFFTIKEKNAQQEQVHHREKKFKPAPLPPDMDDEDVVKQPRKKQNRTKRALKTKSGEPSVDDGDIVSL